MERLARFLKTFFRYGRGLLNFPDGVVAVMSDEERHMSTIPADLRYAASHEWARLEADGSVTVGISDHAQEALGDVVFIELPDVGKP